MRASILLGGLVLLLASPALAGPWAREAGSAFLSFSTEITMDRDEPLVLPAYDATVYAEVGLGQRFTFGADLYQGPDSHTYLLYIQRTLTPGDARHQFAFRLGGGTGDNGRGDASLFLAGAAWGMGFDSPWGGGWAVVDAQVRSRSDGGEEIKVDATLGLAPREDWMVLGQFQAAEYPESDPTLRLQGTVVRRLNDRFSLEAGFVHGLRNTTRSGLKLGLWTEF